MNTKPTLAPLRISETVRTLLTRSFYAVLKLLRLPQATRHVSVIKKTLLAVFEPGNSSDQLLEYRAVLRRAAHGLSDLAKVGALAVSKFVGYFTSVL